VTPRQLPGGFRSTASTSGLPTPNVTPTPTGGIVRAPAAPIKALEAPTPIKMAAPKTIADADALPTLTRKMLSPEERTAFDQMVAEGHNPKTVYAHISALRQAQRLSTLLKGGGS
jgi:hypothetical protein